MSNLSNNPLAAFFRQPKIYISLPSKGKFYKEGTLTLNESGELAVYAMTAKDELMFKTPDALLNGTSTAEVIKSCIPGIVDPWSMPSIDLDAALCAIRIATYGVEMDMVTNCPKCGHENELVLDLRKVLDNLREVEFQTEVLVNDSILIKLRPLNYKEVSEAALKAFEHQRIFSIINDENIADEEKMKLFQESFTKLTELTLDAVASCIVSVETSNGATDNKEFISEFLKNTDKAVFEEINKVVTKSKESAKMPALDTTCKECEHQFKVTMTLDQSDFFGKGF
jgi:hypothetical protein